MFFERFHSVWQMQAAFFPGLGILYKTDGMVSLLVYMKRPPKMPWFAEPIPRRATPLSLSVLKRSLMTFSLRRIDGFHADCDVFKTDWIDNASAFCNEGVNTFCVDDEIAFEGFFANGNTCIRGHPCG